MSDLRDEEKSECIAEAVIAIKDASPHESRHAQTPPPDGPEIRAAIDALWDIEYAYLAVITKVLLELRHIPTS
jgi:hypothetical protein